jgi:hypothetical protein
MTAEKKEAEESLFKTYVVVTTTKILRRGNFVAARL